MYQTSLRDAGASLLAGIAYVSNVAVLPAARRRGLARTLMAEAERIATEWGCRSVGELYMRTRIRGFQDSAPSSDGQELKRNCPCGLCRTPGMTGLAVAPLPSVTPLPFLAP